MHKRNHYEKNVLRFNSRYSNERKLNKIQKLIFLLHINCFDFYIGLVIKNRFGYYRVIFDKLIIV